MTFSTDIYYILVVPDGHPREATALQGFAPSLCESSWLIRAAAFLPSNIFDPAADDGDVVIARKMGGAGPVQWHPQSPGALMSFPVPALAPFTVVLLGKGQDPAPFRAWAQSSPVPPTLVAESGGDLLWDELTLEGLQKRFLAVCDLIPSPEGDPEDVRAARAALERWTKRPARVLGYQVGGHATITPNLMALSAAGFEDMVHGRFTAIDKGDQPYIEQIVRTTNSVLDERTRIGAREPDRTFRRPPDLNLFAPAIYPGFFSRPVPCALTASQKASFVQARNLLQRQSGYAFTATTEQQIRAAFGSKEAPQPHALLSIRQRELALATECVGALAASEISAVVRLPNEINRTAGAVRQFASQYRSSKASRRKRLRAFRDVQARLEQAVPTEFYELIARSRDGVRIIADAHLEWLDIDGLPLALRKNVSRIPVTPGNLFVGEVTARPRLYLTPETFREVLVIRALKKGDRRDGAIRAAFDAAFDAYGELWKDLLDVRYVDVSSEAELVAALAAFSGAIVCFDGHGSHDPDRPAYLHLMDEPLDVWMLRDKIERAPPIVVLSACDIHAADRNHATTANGFLSLGAHAVLGSVFPLQALDAAMFAARLLYRVSTYVPAAVGMFGRALTWTEVVSGMLRMQLLTDFLRALETSGAISQEAYGDVHEKGNMAINSDHEDPFGEVQRLLAGMGVDASHSARVLESTIASSSAISYIHIGRPETILLDTRERLARRSPEETGTAA